MDIWERIYNKGRPMTILMVILSFLIIVPVFLREFLDFYFLPFEVIVLFTALVGILVVVDIIAWNKHEDKENETRLQKNLKALEELKKTIESE